MNNNSTRCHDKREEVCIVDFVANEHISEYLPHIPNQENVVSPQIDHRLVRVGNQTRPDQMGNF